MELVVGGDRAFVATGGRAFDANKPCIVFLHGAGCDHSGWMQPARWFAHHGWSVLAPDLPGHGRSDGRAIETIAAMADWVEHLLDAAGVKAAAVVGHSMGGAIALELAGRDPSRLTRLGLIGTAAAIPVGSALLDAAKSAPQAAYEMMTAWGHGPAARRGGNPVPGLWMTSGTLRVFDRNAAGVLHTDLAACNVWKTGGESAARVACPTSIITAQFDVMTPAKRGGELAAMIKGATRTHIAGAGHMIMTEAPDACLDALIALAADRQ